MGSKRKFSKIEFVSVGTSSLTFAEYPAKNKPKAYSQIIHYILGRKWMMDRRNERNLKPHQLIMSLKKNKVLCVLFHSGRGGSAVFAQDLIFFVLLKDYSDYAKDYTSELHLLVDWQIPELAFIATTLRYIQHFLPKIFAAIQMNNKQARNEKLKVLRSQILNHSSPIVKDLFKSKYSSYSIYSYHNLISKNVFLI